MFIAKANEHPESILDPSLVHTPEWASLEGPVTWGTLERRLVSCIAPRPPSLDKEVSPFQASSALASWPVGVSQVLVLEPGLLEVSTDGSDGSV